MLKTLPQLRWAAKSIGACILAFCAYFFTTHLLDHYTQLKEHLKNISTLFFASAVVISSVAGLLNAIVWHKIVTSKNPASKFQDSYFAWSASRLFRYIPGKIFSYMARHRFQGVSLKDSFSTSIIEILTTVSAIILLATIHFTINTKDFLLASISVVFLITSLYFGSIISLCGKLFAITRFTEYIPQNDPRQALKLLVISIPPIVLHGFAFYILIRYAMRIEGLPVVLATLSLYISGVIAQASLVAPGGLGVREAALVVALVNQGIDITDALLGASLSRVSLVLAETINMITSYSLRVIKK